MKQFFDYKKVMEFAKQSVGKQIAKRNVFLCEDDFNEVVQMTAIKVFNTENTFDSNKGTIRGWIKMLANQALVDFLNERSNKYQHVVDMDASEKFTNLWSVDFNETYDVKISFQAINAYSETLNDTNRKIFSMMVSDAPNKVIAKEFGISELTMNTRIYRLRNGLKRYISTALHPKTIATPLGCIQFQSTLQNFPLADSP